MLKKNISIVIIVVVVIAIGAYAIFHKSPKPATTNTSQSKTVAVNNSVVITKTNSSVGSYLADTSSKTLYTDGTGSVGVSNCSGPCLAAWPVYQDEGSITNLPAGISTIKRSDNGEMQYTYNGMPLYYFASDSKGRVTGNGVSGFVVAKPVASSTTTSSGSSSRYPY